jgi:hypothetical protein
VSAAFQFDAVAHEYREGELVIPSVTQVLAGVGITDYSMVPRAILEHKRDIGEQVHLACQFMDEGSLDWDSIDPAVLNYVLAYESFKKATGFVPRLNEHRQIATVYGMKYGMTLDREGDLNGKPTVIELKATAQIHKAWGIQLAAYDMGLAGVIRQRAAVHLKPNGTFAVEPFTDSNDRSVFASALAVTWWKLNN